MLELPSPSEALRYEAFAQARAVHRRRCHRLDGRRNRRPSGTATGSPGGRIRPSSRRDGAFGRSLGGASTDDSRGVPDPAEGRQRFRCRSGVDARRRRARAGPLQPRRRRPGAGLSEQGAQGHLGRRSGLGPEGGRCRLVSVAQQEPRWCGTRSGGRARRAARGADRARTLGHDELRRGGGAGDRVRGTRVSDSREHRARDSGSAEILRELARQPEVLDEA